MPHETVTGFEILTLDHSSFEEANLLYAALLQGQLAEVWWGQMGMYGPTVSVPHHQQPIIPSCYQSVVALQTTKPAQECQYIHTAIP